MLTGFAAITFRATQAIHCATETYSRTSLIFFQVSGSFCLTQAANWG